MTTVTANHNSTIAHNADRKTLVQVISYFDTMADVVREVPQHVLAQPPHIISSFTQEEKKSMPKVGFLAAKKEFPR